MFSPKKKRDITEELGSGKVLPLIVRLSVPAVIAQLITFLYNIVDRMYVAKIGDTGMDALAALGVVLPITLIIQAFANLIGAGGAPRAGIKMGEGLDDEADGIFNTSFVLLSVIGVIIGTVGFVFARDIVMLFGCPESAADHAVSYLKIYSCGTLFVMLAQGLNQFVLTQGYSLYSMGAILLGAVVNIVLDPIFIFTLGMGVRGSSLATVISQLLSCVCVLGFFFSRKSRFHIRPTFTRKSFRCIVPIVSLGFTPFVMTVTECAIQVVFNICLNRSTGGNRDYTAALTVMLSALQLISLPLNGLGKRDTAVCQLQLRQGRRGQAEKGHRICHRYCLCVLPVDLVGIACRAGDVRPAVLGKRRGHGDREAVLPAVSDGVDHVFRPDDSSERERCARTGEIGAVPCRDAEGDNPDTAVPCSYAFSRLPRSLSLRGDSRFRRRDHHRGGHFHLVPEDFPQKSG